MASVSPAACFHEVGAQLDKSLLKRCSYGRPRRIYSSGGIDVRAAAFRSTGEDARRSIGKILTSLAARCQIAKAGFRGEECAE
jgi:hypothetical protein